MTESYSLLLPALITRQDIYRTEMKNCRREFSEEAVHDLRVATRRLLALAELIRAVRPNPLLKKIQRALKTQLNNFDELRDTQVMLAEISENLETLPALKPFQAHLRRRERRLLQDAEEMVNAIRLGGLAKRIEKVRADLSALEPAEEFNQQILQAVDDVFLTVTRRYGWITPSQPASIHRTRVAFKKFRYMLEIVHPLLPNFPAGNFKRMSDYQTSMGAIQDVEVFLHALTDFAEADVPPEVMQFYERRHFELITAFIEDKGEVFSFWRPDSGQAFPWEMEKDESIHRAARHRRRTRPASAG